MFQFPGFASLAGYQIFDLVGCPIRVLVDLGQCAAPHKLSQLVAPFFACESLGIPHAPFLTSFPPLSAGQYVCLPKMSKNLSLLDYVRNVGAIAPNSAWRITDSNR